MNNFSKCIFNIFSLRTIIPLRFNNDHTATLSRPAVRFLVSYKKHTHSRSHLESDCELQRECWITKYMKIFRIPGQLALAIRASRPEYLAKPPLVSENCPGYQGESPWISRQTALDTKANHPGHHGEPPHIFQTFQTFQDSGATCASPISRQGGHIKSHICASHISRHRGGGPKRLVDSPAIEGATNNNSDSI